MTKREHPEAAGPGDPAAGDRAGAAGGSSRLQGERPLAPGGRRSCFARIVWYSRKHAR
jgi:hypothetical protein